MHEIFVRSILRADLEAKQTRAITSVTSASVEDLAAGNGTLYWNDEASALTGYGGEGL